MRNSSRIEGNFKGILEKRRADYGEIENGFARFKGKCPGKPKQDEAKKLGEKQNWAKFTQNMISEEDIRAFNNDLRNRNNRIVIEEISEAESGEARKIWDFGKKIGLLGSDKEMIRSLQMLEQQVDLSVKKGRGG